MLESALISLWILLILLLQGALAGGALAAGAWIVWRYLERRARPTPPPADRDEVVIHWVPLVLVVMAAAWFAFVWPAQRNAAPPGMGWILIAPYVVNILVITGIVWLVRKAIASGAEQPRTGTTE